MEVVLKDSSDTSGKQAQNLGLGESQLLDTIHKDALSVLEEVGVKCSSPQVRQIFVFEY